MPVEGEVRDVLSTLFVLRAQPLQAGRAHLHGRYAGRKIWRLHGPGRGARKHRHAARQGRFRPHRRRRGPHRRPEDEALAHVWVSDDARRLPLVAIGEMRGKTLRAQLTAAKR